MGSSRSSSLRIGGDSSAVIGSGRTGGAFDRSAGVDLRDALGSPLFPLTRVRGEYTRLSTPGVQSI